jgi:hypothetical protein
MTTNVLHYHNDGANRQTQAALAMFQSILCDGLEESWDDKWKRYKANIEIARWENCREQGYVLSLRSDDCQQQLNVAFFEHRNTDSICAIKWHQCTLNSPTIDSADFNGECYSDKYDTSFDVGYGEAEKMGRWIHDQFVQFWNETKKPE